MEALTLTKIISGLFGAGLMINALLFIPQSIRIFKSGDSSEISLITFIGFLLIQFVAVLYGYLHHDYILMYGYLFSMLTCGFVTFLAIYFRVRPRPNNVNCQS